MRWLVPLLVVVTVGPARSEPATLGWSTNLAEARARAAKSGKPMLVMFRCVP